MSWPTRPIYYPWYYNRYLPYYDYYYPWYIYDDDYYVYRKLFTIDHDQMIESLDTGESNVIFESTNK